MNAVLFEARGKGPHPTVILMHGLPGNERNLDLAQAIRRAGWDVLTFTYRGAWGSPGDFSIANAMEDTRPRLDFARSPRGAKFGIDTRHIVLAGHSMGGATAIMTAARRHRPRRADPDRRLEHRLWNEQGRDHPRGDWSTASTISAIRSTAQRPKAIADEVDRQALAMGSDRAPGRASRSCRSSRVTRKYGAADENRPTTAALRKAGNRRLTAIEMNTDHSFADHRIALARRWSSWLNGSAAQR